MHPNGASPGYGSEFCKEFIWQLRRCDCPQYPDLKWWAALARADVIAGHAVQCVRQGGTDIGHIYQAEGQAEGGPRQLYAHNYGFRDAEGTYLRQVAGACRRWLYTRDAL